VKLDAAVVGLAEDAIEDDEVGQPATRASSRDVSRLPARLAFSAP
jgi:hypothetical protein